MCLSKLLRGDKTEREVKNRIAKESGGFLCGHPYEVAYEGTLEQDPTLQRIERMLPKIPKESQVLCLYKGPELKNMEIILGILYFDSRSF
jgi:hypothetical protein